MAVYAIAQISITDRDRYNQYQACFMAVFARFRGRLLAADASPHIVEGVWTHEKVILMAFPDWEAFEEWAQSPEYQALTEDRKAGSDGVVLLVKGLA